MFVLMPQVMLPKRLDVAHAAEALVGAAATLCRARRFTGRGQ